MDRIGQTFQRLAMLLFWMGNLTAISLFFASPVMAAPNDPTILRQFQSDQVTAIPVGGASTGTAVDLPFQFDTTTSTGPKTTSVVTAIDQSGVSATISITPSGTNRFLAVHVAYDGVETISAADFHGQAMIKACSQSGDGFSSDIWYLANPDATTANVTLTFTGTGSPEMAITAANFINVNQVTPVSAFNCAENIDYSADPSISITANADQVIFAGVSTYTDSETLTSDSLMTDQSQASSANRYQATATKIGQNGSTTLRWDAEPRWPWSAAAIAITAATPETPTDYELQYELQHTNTTFTGTATHTQAFSFNGIPQAANISITGLDANQNYHWQVRSCTQDLLTCSNWVSFGANLETETDFSTTGASSPDAPSSLGPPELVDGSVSASNHPELSFTLSDPDAGENVKYHIQISQQSDFSSPDVDYTSALAAQGATTFTVGQAAGSGSYTAGNESQVLYDGSYYWRVLAIDAAAHQSAYSVANSGAVAFSVTGSASPDWPIIPTNTKQFKSNGEKQLATGAQTTDSTENLYVKMASYNQTGALLDSEAHGGAISASNVQFSMTPSGSNRLLLVSVGFNSEFDVTSMTFDGQALTQVCEVSKFLGFGVYSRQQLWSLVAPNTTTGTLSTTFGGTSTDINIAGSVFTGVNQATPISHSNCDDSPSLDHHPNISVGSAVGETVYGSVSTYVGFANQLTASPFIEQVSDLAHGNDMMRAGYRTATGINTTLAWTGERNWPWRMVAASITPASTQSTLQLIPRVEIRPLATSFTNTANFTGVNVPYAGSAVYGAVAAAGLADGTSYHWQAQACTSDLSYCSAWTSYGANDESEADFTKVANLTPSDPDKLGDIPINGNVETNLNAPFQFHISDPNPNEQLRFQIQVSDTANFSNIVQDYTSSLTDEFLIEGFALLSYFEYGQPAYDGTYNVGSPGDDLLPDTNYYWRVRTTDSGGLTSGWTDNFFTTNQNAPTLSNVNLNSITSSSVGATWDTDLYSNSFFAIGSLNGATVDTSPTQTTPYVLSHTYNFGGLLSCSELSLRAKSANSIGATGQSSVLTFPTSGCLGNSPVLDASTQLIDPAIGGSVSLADGATSLTVTVPTGAHSGNADWQIHQLQKADVLTAAPAPTSGAVLGDFFFDLKALASATAQVSVTSPVTVSLDYDVADTQGYPSGEIKLQRWTGSSWTPLSGCVNDSATHTVTCTTTSLGVVALFGVPAPAAGPQPSSSPEPSTQPITPGPACNPEYRPPTPEIFYVIESSDSARIYFAPSTSSTHTYVISYGTTITADQYATTFEASQTTGVLTAEVSNLTAATYYFKVKAVTECAASDWSPVVSASTIDRLPASPPPDVGRLKIQPFPYDQGATESAGVVPLPTEPPGQNDTPPGPVEGLIPYPQIQQAAQEIARAVAEATTKAVPFAPLALATAAVMVSLNTLAVASTVALVAEHGLSWSLISALLRMLGLLPTFLPQGFVYDTKTKRPVPFTLLHFEGKLTKTGERIVETVVSDTRGIFPRVKLAAGEYVLEARNDLFQFPTRLPRPVFSSDKEFYKGEMFLTADYDPAQFFTIPVDQKAEVAQRASTGQFARRMWSVLLQLISWFTWPLFIASLIATYFKPTPLNLGISAAYLLSLLWKQRDHLGWGQLRGVVTDQNNQPLENAVVSFGDVSDFQVKAVTVSDKHGRFRLNVPRGSYVYQVRKAGYIASDMKRMVLPVIDTRQLRNPTFKLEKQSGFIYS